MTMLEELRSRLPSEMERSKQIVQSKQAISTMRSSKQMRFCKMRSRKRAKRSKIMKSFSLQQDVQRILNARRINMQMLRSLRQSGSERTSGWCNGVYGRSDGRYESTDGTYTETQDEIHAQVTERISAEIADNQANTVEIEGQLFAIKNPASASRGRTMDQFRQPDK